MSKFQRIQTHIDTGTAPAIGAIYPLEEEDRTFQLTVTGSGAVSATAIIEASTDGVGYVTVGTLSASGTENASDSFPADILYPYHRATLQTLTGTRAIITSSSY